MDNCENKHDVGTHNNEERNGYEEAETITETKESEIVKEVFMMKDNLSNQDESESQLMESLSRLESMPMSVEILKATMIGRNVKFLRKHKSKTISSMAKKLVRSWREVADEWMKSGGEVAVATTMAAAVHNHIIEQPLKLDDSQCSKQETKSDVRDRPNHIVISHRRRRVVSQQNLHQKLDIKKPSSLALPSPQKSNSSTLDDKSIRERIEASKRRLQEGYRQAEKVKKQRTVQLIEIQDLPKHHHKSN